MDLFPILCFELEIVWEAIRQNTPDPICVEFQRAADLAIKDTVTHPSMTDIKLGQKMGNLIIVCHLLNEFAGLLDKIRTSQSDDTRHLHTPPTCTLINQWYYHSIALVEINVLIKEERKVVFVSHP